MHLSVSRMKRRDRWRFLECPMRICCIHVWSYQRRKNKKLHTDSVMDLERKHQRVSVVG